MDNKLQNTEMNKTVTPEITRNERSYSPNVDIIETEKEIILTSELAGVEEENLEVILDNNVLTITGKMEEESFKDYELIYSEYRPVKYERSFTVSNEFNKDKLKAVLKDGLLNLTIPKAEKTAAKKIKVKSLR